MKLIKRFWYVIVAVLFGLAFYLYKTNQGPFRRTYYFKKVTDPTGVYDKDTGKGFASYESLIADLTRRGGSEKYLKSYIEDKVR